MRFQIIQIVSIYVDLKDGASINPIYQDGVTVFTISKGGLIYEASIGGQHFKYKPIEDNL